MDNELINTNKISIGIVANEMNLQRQMQLSCIDSLDNKAGILIGFESLLFVSLLTYSFQNIFDILAFIVLIISIALLIKSYQVKPFKFNPNPNELIDKYMFYPVYPDKDIKDTPSSVEQIIVDQRKAYNDNSKLLHKKGSVIKWAVVLLFISILLFGINKIGIGGEKKMNDKDQLNSSEAESVLKPNLNAENIIRLNDEPVADANPKAENIIQKNDDKKD